MELWRNPPTLPATSKRLAHISGTRPSRGPCRWPGVRASKKGAPGKGSKKGAPKKSGKSGSGFEIPPKRTRQSPKSAAKPVPKAPPVARVTKISGPLGVSSEEALGPHELLPAPRWDTFCNHMCGEWLGQYGAFTPWEGDPEDVWLDPQGRYIKMVYTRCLEDRVLRQSELGESDQLLRVVGRSASLEGLREIRLPAVDDRLEADSLEDVDLEGFGNNVEGAVVFDGGVYSVGPEYIGVQGMPLPHQRSSLLDMEEEMELEEEEEEEEAAPEEGEEVLTEVDEEALAALGLDAEGDGNGAPGPSGIHIVEQCLAWAGDQRRRLRVTLAVGQPDGGELDVQVKRIVLYKEHWYGTPPAPSPGQSNSTPGVDQPAPATSTTSTWPSSVKKLLPAHQLEECCLDLPRPTPEQLRGSWKVFTITAESLPPSPSLPDEDSSFTSGWLYSAQETAQLWGVQPSQEGPLGIEGATFYLPGGCIASFKMMPDRVPTAVASHSNGNGCQNGAGITPRTFVSSFGWWVQENTLLLLEREYDGGGNLRAVRHGTAVKGGWSGGRM